MATGSSGRRSWKRLMTLDPPAEPGAEDSIAVLLAQAGAEPQQ